MQKREWIVLFWEEIKGYETEKMKEEESLYENGRGKADHGIDKIGV